MPADVFPIKTTLPLEKARVMIAEALAEGRRQKLQPLTVVVVDTGGHVISMDREDGSGILRADVARGKAVASLGIGISSGTIGARNKGRDAFLSGVAAASDGRFIPVGGGVLVLDEQRHVIGAIGASGDTSDADEACVVAGVRAAGYEPGLDAAS
ncbi:uncharacterized protein GlcG (DUF336 family) [Natronocella acetinitrilica]|uniref:Uncharacterized protein GlcG (DUF336 family) n=1 Tax=Natronocella acetinitrilica TaxID=414046 RepID=A0AAE3G230_9GAMM|nr:heme-binding protein [Natronocella acetinitrilica]MCP1673733.1 uncharacterized protein GlcG (DUF336 family) [Natronocella acetinitrilica]